MRKAKSETCGTKGKNWLNFVVTQYVLDKERGRFCLASNLEPK